MIGIQSAGLLNHRPQFDFRQKKLNQSQLFPNYHSGISPSGASLCCVAHISQQVHVHEVHLKEYDWRLLAIQRMNEQIIVQQPLQAQHQWSPSFGDILSIF